MGEALNTDVAQRMLSRGTGMAARAGAEVSFFELRSKMINEICLEKYENSEKTKKTTKKNYQIMSYEIYRKDGKRLKA